MIKVEVRPIRINQFWSVEHNAFGTFEYSKVFVLKDGKEVTSFSNSETKELYDSLSKLYTRNPYLVVAP